MMQTIKGMNILVAGATGSIGTELVKLLAASGANLFLTGRNESKLADISAIKGVAGYFAADISDSRQVQLLKEKYFSVFSGP